MSDCMKPDQPGLWRDGNERTYVAYMESEALKVRDLGTGEILSHEQAERVGSFRRLPSGIDLTSMRFVDIPDRRGCWYDGYGNLRYFRTGRLDDEDVIRLRYGNWCWAPSCGITPKMLREWGPWASFESVMPARQDRVPWHPESDDSSNESHPSRVVRLPAVQSFGRLKRDKWLAVKTLEESAELAEAAKQWLKALDPDDPSGIDIGFDDCAGLLAKHGMTGDADAMRGLDAARTAWRDRMTAKRRQAMLDELADVLQTLANLAAACDITDKELEQAMNDCRERNRRRGRL